MTIVETKGGEINHRYLMRKSKHELSRMYLDLLQDRERLANRLDALLPHLEYARETHVQWRDCDQTFRDQNPDIGDSEFHAQMVHEYNERIEAIKEAVAFLRGG